ncbi:MAG: stressosome-associated protein Prli42 [Lachnospiraceae bacterium]|nr:stressosome-associated protein Prli42 [Lachnospiraceae bacterium]
MYNKKFQKTVVAVIAGIMILTMVLSTIAAVL